MNIGKSLEKRWNINGQNKGEQISKNRKTLCEHEMRFMWERDIQKTKPNSKEQDEVLQSQLQKQNLYKSSEQEIQSDKIIWGEKPCLERWGNIQKTERELQRCKVCEMSKRVSINGEERWICNGTQNCNGEALREMFDKNGSCPLYRPQPEQQQDRELDAIQEQCRTQESREVIEYWNKFGTCLKPSFEPIIVARKPFKGSLVDNIIQYGVGGINIDECRVGTEERTYKGMSKHKPEGAGTFRDDNWEPKDIEVSVNGRFPANTILTYDQITFDEVCGGFPVTKSTGGLGDSGSAARYFMNCKYTRKDEEIWKQLLVNNVESNLEILKATKGNIAQMNVGDLLKELKDHYAKYVGNQLDLIETPIVQNIVKILTWDFKIETSQVIQDFIINSKKCIQFLNLVQFVEKMDNIDTTQTTQNLLKLFGYVKVVITNYIQGNIEYDQKRYIYTPKASKKDRDEGLDEFENKCVTDGRNKPIDNAFNRGETLRHNIHPTVKPTELMQYLVRLVTPNNGIVLDPFMGSGSTGKAAMYENLEKNKNYTFIGIEKDEEYCKIAESRINYVKTLGKKMKFRLS